MVERVVGVCLLGYVLFVAVQVIARAIGSDSGVPFDEALLMIAANRHLYLTSMYSGLLANFLLLVIAAGLYSTFAVHQVYLARVGAFLLLGAAIISLMSSGAGLAVASLIQEFTGEQLRPGSLLSSAQAVESIREALGRIGFALSGVGIIVLASLISWRKPLPQWLGWMGILVGVMMLFIWSDSAAVLHRIGGAGYLLWLAVTGGWLLFRGTRHVAIE